MTNLDITAFLAIGVLGPLGLPLGVPLPLLETVGGGVTSSSLTFLRSLRVILPEADLVICWGVLVVDGGRAIFSGVAPIVSKCPRRACVRIRWG